MGGACLPYRIKQSIYISFSFFIHSENFGDIALKYCNEVRSARVRIFKETSEDKIFDDDGRGHRQTRGIPIVCVPEDMQAKLKIVLQLCIRWLSGIFFKYFRSSVDG